MRTILALTAPVMLVAAGGCGHARPPGLVAALERLASEGNAEAVYHLGMAYQTGSGVPEDHAKALAAFRRAADLGDPLASYKLGCYYDRQGGDLLAPDFELALRHKLVAARAGYALAQQDVGSLYARRGDSAAALAWLERSAAQGWSGGLMALASVYNGAPGVTPDAARTVAYFRLFLTRSKPDDDQIAWLKAFEARLSPADRQRGDDIVARYRPAPTLLTIKALSGQLAAQSPVRAESRR